MFFCDGISKSTITADKIYYDLELENTYGLIHHMSIEVGALV